ncbi:MAG: FliI/YscN family ATPase [Pyrinomonadaceae bacterium]
MLSDVCGVQDLLAEVVGFRSGEALLLPLGDCAGVSMGAEVIRTHQPLRVRVGEDLLGRVINGLGEPIDGLGPLQGAWREVTARPPAALQRQRVSQIMPTGVRSIDALLSVGEGQRVGLIAAAGVGKSTLLGMLARGCEADVTVVGLIGERGREVRDFIERDLGVEGLQRSVVIVATSDEPALVRVKAAHAATAVAEHFRERGLRVLLLLDSITRFARALREVGLAAGEPPARAGFPPSTFAELPRLLERAGNSARGSITAFYTVLVEGDDMSEPVADETRSILDGHIVLSRALAEGGHFPAVDIGKSISRVMGDVATLEHALRARKLREVLSVYEDKKDLIAVGAYKRGLDTKTDAALAKTDSINAFLQQESGEHARFDLTLNQLQMLFP